MEVLKNEDSFELRVLKIILHFSNYKTQNTLFNSFLQDYKKLEKKFTKMFS